MSYYLSLGMSPRIELSVAMLDGMEVEEIMKMLLENCQPLNRVSLIYLQGPIS